MFTKKFILKFCAISIVSAGKYGNLTPYLSFKNVEKWLNDVIKKRGFVPYSYEK